MLGHENPSYVSSQQSTKYYGMWRARRVLEPFPGLFFNASVPVLAQRDTETKAMEGMRGLGLRVLTWLQFMVYL